MGTCFDILTKPVPLTQRHVDVFRHKVIMGTHNKKTVKLDEFSERADDGRLNDTFEESEDLDLAADIPIDDPSQIALHKEMMAKVTSPAKEIRFSCDQIDFAFTEKNRISEPKPVTLTNNFKFPI